MAWKVVSTAIVLALAAGLHALAGSLGAPSWGQWLAFGIIAGPLLVVVVIELLWQLGEDDPRLPDASERAAFEAMTLHDVRTRADRFHSDAQNAPKKAAAAYGLPGDAWRYLEQAMRDAGAQTVGDLPEAEVTRWARRLNVGSDREWFYTPRPPPEAQARTEVAEVPRDYGWLGRLRVRGRPSVRPRARRPW